MEIDNMTADVNQTNVASKSYDMALTLKVLYLIIALLGVMGNGLVLYVFFKLKELRVVPNLLISHQSFVDLVVSCFLMITFITPAISLKSLSITHYAFASFVCKCFWSQFAFWASIRTSTINLVFLTLERYFAVVHPFTYRERTSMKSAAVVSILAWCLGALAVLNRVVVYSLNDDGECTNYVKDSGRVVIAFVSFTITLVIPLVVMVFVYTSIIRVLRASKKFGSNKLESSTAPDSVTSTQVKSLKVDTVNVSGRAESSKEVQTASERATRSILGTMAIVCLTYLICWAPNQILYLHHNTIKRQDWTTPPYRFVILLASFNACVNPFIYAFKYRSFRKGLKELFPKYVPSSFE